MKYVDVHAHLNEEIFDKDRNEILKNCKEKEIFVINCSGDKKGNKKSLELLDYPNVKVCLGIYPVQTAEMRDSEFFDELNFIEKNKDKISGIGEVGLDFHWIKDKKKQEKQIERFKEIIWMANKNKLPLNVHSRKAEKETIEILSESAKVPVIIHCFGGSLTLANEGIKSGFYFSIPPIIIRSNSFKALARKIPITQLLTETDSPYLGPTKERNTPENIPIVVKQIAEIKEIDFLKAQKQLLKNAQKVFNILQ